MRMTGACPAPDPNDTAPETPNPDKSRILLAAHDLRNPITGILSAAEYLLEDLPAPRDEHVALLQAIHASSRFMLRMVDDILEVSLIESSILEFRFEPTDLVTLVKQDLALNRLVAEGKQVQMDLETDGPAAVIHADASKIYRVIDTLVTNAIKFSYPGGKIEIRAGVRGGRAILSVRDHGMGIPAKKRKSLLRPQPAPMRGLGAARRIVDGHGGQIKLESEPGKGSTFTISLPLARAIPVSRDASRAGPGRATHL